MRGLATLVFGGVIIYAVSSGMNERSTGPARPTSSPVLIDNHNTQRTRTDCLACADMEVFAEAAKYVADSQARALFIGEKLTSGQCVFIKAWTDVFVTDTSWRGYAHVRRVGQIQELWVQQSAFRALSRRQAGP